MRFQQQSKPVWLGLFLLGLLCLPTSELQATEPIIPHQPRPGVDRPNIVWIMSEDNSKHYLKLFDESGAATPNIEAMAESGLTFTRAFSNAPVCSVARTTLITGVYAPRAGTHYHRKTKTAVLPDGWELFPAYLRKAGYYTTNNAKEDYNCACPQNVWDESGRKAHWSHRKQNPTTGSPQPFFHVQTFTDSHESSLHFNQAWADAPQLKTDPKSVTLAPYHPDTTLFRTTYSRYHDRIGVIDQKVGKVINELKQAGEIDNTIVFYFGDHGGVLPRGKGYVFESGLHVPLVIRIPEKWRAVSPFPMGTSVSGFVQFVDFAPTVLKLAGIEVPQHMDGNAFLGKGVSKDEIERRDTTFGYADRMDEKYDMCRSLRIGNWKYIRNFNAIYPDGLQNNYRYEMLAYQQWRQQFRESKLNNVQSQFFKAKPTEMLFDLNQDPHEVDNLAEDTKHQAKLQEMRQKLNRKLSAINDLGFFPESTLVDEVTEPFVSFGKSQTKILDRCIQVANLAAIGRPDAATLEQLKAAIQDDNALIRHWGFVVAASLGKSASELRDVAAKAASADPSIVNRIRAWEFLGMLGEDPLPSLTTLVSETDSPTVALIGMQSIVLFRDGPFHFEFQSSTLTPTSVDSQVIRRLGYLKNMSPSETRVLVKQRMKQERNQKKPR